MRIKGKKSALIIRNYNGIRSGFSKFLIKALGTM